ncbi:MAG: hypothetical protein A2539_10435 [Elusimicrobia bacterium RIFOXYD2_FULL_34_15]|nr:MAG: hypothetical protein A2539_10435 [Elusimicrobia bacterium RIFOXYD2_FULL_34_15]
MVQSKRQCFLVIGKNYSEVEKTAISELSDCLKKTGYGVVLLTESELSKKSINGDIIVIGQINSSNLVKEILNRNKVNVNTNLIGDEGYILKSFPNSWSKSKNLIVVSGYSSKAIIYSAFKLIDKIEYLKVIPKNLNIITKPYFKIREWETQAFQGGFNLPYGGSVDRPIEEFTEIVKKIIRQAPRYGINKFQLTGRSIEPGMDLNWFLDYKFFPKLHKQFQKWGQGKRERLEILRKLATFGHKYGLEMIMWDHEMVYPPEFLNAYPELKGIDAPICFSKPFMMEFIEGKVDEFFEIAPEIDGLNLTLSEVSKGGHLFSREGCKCNKCMDFAPKDRILSVVNAMHRACNRNGKKLEVRTYNMTPEEGKVAYEAFSQVPEDIVLMTKCMHRDFYCTSDPNNTLVGAFKNAPQIIEYTACPEGNGFAYIPAVLADFYKDRITYAADKKVDGLVARLDYHLQYSHAHFYNPGPAVLTFDLPNEFNIVTFSNLAWNPNTNMKTLWSEWASKKYGEKASALVVSALSRTQEICQKALYILGFYRPHFLNMFSHLEHLLRMEEDAPHFSPMPWDPTNPKYQELYKKITQPTEESLKEILAEKDSAISMCLQSIKDIEKAKKYLSAKDYSQLSKGLDKERDVAEIWKWFLNVFFRYLMLIQNKKDEIKFKELLDDAVQKFILYCFELEEKYGREYPVYPTARGISAYDFLEELYQDHLSKITKDYNSVLKVWLAVIDRSKPTADDDFIFKVKLEVPGDVNSIKFEKNDIVVEGKNGEIIKMATGLNVSGHELVKGKKYSLKLERKEDTIHLVQA